MTKTISVRLDKSLQDKLAFLYKFYEVESNSISKRFIEMLEKIYSEKTGQSESEEIIETLPSCPMIPTLITEGKHKNMVFCPNPKIVGLKKGNHVPLGVCLNCWTRQENYREHKGIPTSETTFAPEWDVKETKPKKPKSKPVQKQEEYKVCKNPTCNTHVKRGSVKQYPDWIPDLCPLCWLHKKQGYDPKEGFIVPKEE